MKSFFSSLQNFLATLAAWLFPSIVKLLIIIAVSLFLKYLIDLFSDGFVKQAKNYKRAKTLREITHSTSSAIITTIAIIMVLHELGLDVRPILASAGILGVAFSLGAQSLMKDVINGFFILLEDQYAIGDLIKVGDCTGTVKTMNLRTTTLEDSTGKVHIIPNGEIKQVSVLKTTSDLNQD